MKIEPTEWNPPPNAGRRSALLTALLTMPVGDVWRIHHDGRCVSRAKEARQCTLTQNLSRYKRLGKGAWESYHEADHIAVVKRIA